MADPETTFDADQLLDMDSSSIAAVATADPDLMGRVPQRAYLTDPVSMAQAEGWESYEALQRALPEDQKLVRRPDGWYRRVMAHTGDSIVRDGVLYHQRSAQYRRVGLSIQACRHYGLRGIEADYYTGNYWIRRGRKPEFDLQIMAQRAPDDEVEYEQAPPSDQARATQVIAQQTAAQTATVVAEPPARKGKEKS